MKRHVMMLSIVLAMCGVSMPVCAGVAQGSLVMMYRGGTQPIEMVQKGDFLKSGNGTSIMVQEKFVSPGDEETIVFISTQLGTMLMVTLDQPVITPSGIITAQALRQGDTILTTTGSDTIAFITYGQSELEIYDLQLQCTNQSQANSCSFSANGILVGGFEF
ncbi:MAG: hypothetical protein AAB066_01635 [Candidatus Margulisiibacteriota bacterium]